MQLSMCSRDFSSRSTEDAFLRRSKAVGARGLVVLSGWIRRERVRYWALIWGSGIPGARLRTAYLEG